MGLWSDGCMAEKVEVPRVNLVPRPEGVEAWQASLLEPLAVGLNTVDRLRLVLGEIVLVLGQGPIGLALTRLCALSGAGRLIVTDAREAPFAVSRPTAPPTASTSPRPTAGRGRPDRRRRRRRRHRDLGLSASSAVVLDVVRKEGRIAHIGWANDLPPLPVIPIMAKTLTVFGVGGNGGGRGTSAAWSWSGRVGWTSIRW